MNRILFKCIFNITVNIELEVFNDARFFKVRIGATRYHGIPSHNVPSLVLGMGTQKVRGSMLGTWGHQAAIPCSDTQMVSQSLDVKGRPTYPEGKRPKKGGQDYSGRPVGISISVDWPQRVDWLSNESFG